MTHRLAIFDCDGTLVDSQANICMAMEHAFEGAGLTPPRRHDIRRVVGLSLVESMRVLLPDAEDKCHRDMLSEMDACGWLLGVATGKSDRGLIRCLDHHAITGLFVTLQTADRHPSKPHPSMVYQALADAGTDARNAVVIGDTVYDIHMGRAAGTRTVGVNWGYHSVEDLREAGADYIAESMDDLKTYLMDFA